jgi:hypothetical protein
VSKPKRIVDPHQGHYQVVVTFRCRPQLLSPHQLRDQIEQTIRATIHDLAALYVTAYEVGVQGSASEFEGTVGPLALTEDVEPVRPTRDLDTGGRT